MCQVGSPVSNFFRCELFINDKSKTRQFLDINVIDFDDRKQHGLKDISYIGADFNMTGFATENNILCKKFEMYSQLVCL